MKFKHTVIIIQGGNMRFITTMAVIALAYADLAQISPGQSVSMAIPARPTLMMGKISRPKSSCSTAPPTQTCHRRP